MENISASECISYRLIEFKLRMCKIDSGLGGRRDGINLCPDGGVECAGIMDW